MTAYGGNGSFSSNVTAANPAYPAGIPAGALIGMEVGYAEATNTPPTLPGGWTRKALATGGSGAFGSETGQRNIAIYVRDAVATGTESGTVAVTGAGSATGRAITASIFYVPSTIAGGSTWDVQGFTGSDNALDTAYSAALTPVVAGTQSAAGDLLFGATATIPSAASLGTRTLTWGTITGTNSVATQPQSIAYTSGNALRTGTFWVAHPAGVGNTTGTPTYAAVASQAAAGATAMIRIREIGVNTAPSVSIAVDDNALSGGDIAHLTATVTDSDGTVASEGWTHNAPSGVVTAGRALTFTAPYIRDPATYTFTYTATDNDGATTVRTQTVTVDRWLTWEKTNAGTVRPYRDVPIQFTNPVAEPTIVLDVDNGNGSATLTWTITPNGAPVSGVYFGRDGAGAFESASPILGLTGSQPFTGLTNGTTYNLYVIPVINGVKRTEFKTSAVANPAGGGGLPTYPGFTLQYTLDTSYDNPVWDWQTGREHISQGYCGVTGKEHVAFDSVNGVQIKMRKRTTPITVGGYSLPYDTAEGYLTGDTDAILPNYFRGRAVWQMTAFHVGLFPAFAWFRPRGGGEGEIDWWESFGGHIGTSMAVNKTTMISTPYNTAPYSQNYVIQAPVENVGATKTSILLTDHVYEIEKIPNRVRTWIDGVPMTEHTRGGTNGFGGTQNMTTTNWDRCLEVETQKWYYRITGQIGDDPAKPNPSGNAGVVPTNFAGSDMRLKELSFWSWNG